MALVPVVQTIFDEIGRVLSLKERWDLFSSKYGGKEIKRIVDEYYKQYEFYGEEGIAICLMDGEADGNLSFPPYVTGTGKYHRDRYLYYVVSTLQPGEIYSDLAALSEQQRRTASETEIFQRFLEALKPVVGQAEIVVTGKPEPRVITTADFEDKRWVVVRNDIIPSGYKYVRNPQNAQNTFFCAMREEVL